MYYDLEKQYLKILESIKKYGGFPSRYSMLDINLALEHAIESVKLRIPVNVTSKLWKLSKLLKHIRRGVSRWILGKSTL